MFTHVRVSRSSTCCVCLKHIQGRMLCLERSFKNSMLTGFTDGEKIIVFFCHFIRQLNKQYNTISSFTIQ